MIKKRLIKLLSGAEKYIAYNVLWQWLALLAQVAVVFTAARLLGDLREGNFNWQSAAAGACIFAAASGIRVLCERMASRASYLASRDVKRILRDRIYEKLLRLGASYRERISTAEVVQVCTEGVEQLEIYFGKYLSQLFYSLIAPLTLFALLFHVSWKASLVLLVCVPLIPLSIVAVQKFAKRLLGKYWGIYTELGDSFLENLQGLTTLKIYQADERKAQEMDEEAQRFRRITMKVLTMQLNSTSVMDIVAYGGAAVGMIVALSEYLGGALHFEGAVCIILLASEFFIPLRLLGSFFHIAMNGMAASDKIFRLLDMEEPEQGTERTDAASVEIRMEDVDFSYEENRQILTEINLSIPAGSFAALVGESGCGKSTVAGILAGRNKGYKGKVLLSGKELSAVREEDLMDQVTLVRHNSYLFKGTVAYNLRMAAPNATTKEMEEALRKVNLWEFLQTQQGLETPVKEKGSNFSGGQCQRLALARALLHDTPVYIFDEAASNIDAESEEMIMEVIRQLAHRKTVLLISHRLSNVVDCDCIYMIKDGGIEACGTHRELMERKGSYQRLFESQQKLEAYGKEARA